ncbi:hypothetical protein FA15DRAFT_665891 [Coprinopsis marcescibilis]|uniref:Uncharacterized protein n=1 Tax=Coprinopsis marcescibilis TaxID=230819 RepID=A0A5C3L5D5_COPMA|nr:hypothetical protein FA15DRAFT_665891 [Coprinopsis marcescibilis]
MRTCAVFANNRAVVGLFSVLGLFVVALAIAHAPRVSCSGAKVVESRIATDLLSVFTVVYEILATAFLGVGCYRNMVHGSLKEQKNGLAFFMLKEGMLYSGFVTLFTTTAMVLNYAAPLGSFFQRLLNALTIPISGIMAARFVLHIRERQARELDLDSGILDSPVMFQMDPQLGKPSSRDSSDADSIETITDDDVSQIYPSRFNNGGFGAGSSSRGQDESSMV